MKRIQTLLEAPGQHRRGVLLAVFMVCAVPSACTPPPPRVPSNIVRQVDHILIASSQAKGLLALLTDAFELPVAWPMADHGGFASGGVAVANVNLEIISTSSPGGDGTSRWTGFALEPEPLQASVAELDARGIRHGAPAPFKSKLPTGLFGTRWTTVGLPMVSSDRVEVFLCQYEGDVPARRRRWREQLQSRDGGPLTVHSVRELVLGAADVGSMRGRWQALLAPLRASDEGVWAVGPGPAIRVMPAQEDGVLALVVNVRSLERARVFLKDQGLLGAEEAATLTVASPELAGLKISLVERP